MPTIELKGDSFDGVRLLAAMYYPQDKNSREHFLALCDCDLRINAAEKAGASTIEMPVATLKSVLAAPSHSDFVALTTNKKIAGSLAGDVLLSVYMMGSTGVPEPSLRKAFFGLQSRGEADKKANRPGEGYAPASEPTIRKFWEEYRTVAHFWAAYRLLEAYPLEDMPVVSEVFFGGDLRPLLTVAQMLLEFGCDFTPSRVRKPEPLLDTAAVWRLGNSNLPMWRASVTALPDWLQQALESYQKRQYA